MIWLLNTRIGRWLGGLVAGFLLLWFTMQAGKRHGRSEASAARAKANLKASQKAKEIRHAIESSDDQYLVDLLTGKLHNGKR